MFAIIHTNFITRHDNREVDSGFTHFLITKSLSSVRCTMIQQNWSRRIKSANKTNKNSFWINFYLLISLTQFSNVLKGATIRKGPHTPISLKCAKKAIVCRVLPRPYKYKLKNAFDFRIPFHQQVSHSNHSRITKSTNLGQRVDILSWYS